MAETQAHSSRTVVVVALAGNLAIAVTKFAAGLFTGSAAMLSEGIHSLVDSGNQMLLLLGMHRAERRPNARHPFGYGREVYFWGFVVAVLLFGLGAGWSIVEGVHSLGGPAAHGSPLVNYAVLGISGVFESISWTVAVRAFRARTPGERLLAALRRSKDPAVFIALLEDSAALVGITVAFFGILLSDLLGNPDYDAAASIVIGLVLAAVAAFLARECKSLLIGESADSDTVRGIRDLVERDPRVERMGDVMTVHLGPEDIVLAAELDFADRLSADEVEDATGALEAAIRQRYPAVRHVFLKPQALGARRRAA